MLVLSRRRDEEIVIGSDGLIVIKILRAANGNVRVGVTAPDDVAVHRREVYDAKRRAKTI